MQKCKHILYHFLLYIFLAQRYSEISKGVTRLTYIMHMHKENSYHQNDDTARNEKTSKTVAKTTTKNILCSPYSITSILCSTIFCPLSIPYPFLLLSSITSAHFIATSLTRKHMYTRFLIHCSSALTLYFRVFPQLFSLLHMYESGKSLHLLQKPNK